jgi:hypothetical protein
LATPRAIKAVPTGRTAAQENRTFLGRPVHYLVAEAGMRQFLDIGAGLPRPDNVPEVPAPLGRPAPAR